MNGTELAVQEKHDLTPAIWAMIKEMAPVMHQSRLFGVASQEQAAAIMLKGYELGLPITASFEFINVIGGKPSLSPRGALALLNSQGTLDSYKLNRLTDDKGNFTGFECYMKRGKIEHTAKWTLEDARRAKLVKSDGAWESYPENMCMWRAIGFCADVVAPDITGGMTTFLKAAEQFNVSVDDQGNFIEGKFSEPVKAETVKLAPAHTEYTLTELIGTYSAESIMSANGGMIPGTQEEINLVAKALEGVLQ